MELYTKNATIGRRSAPSHKDAGPGEIDSAARAADAAFTQYSAVPQRERAAFLERIAFEIELDADAIVAQAAEESSLPKARLENEKNRTLYQLRSMADLLRDGSWVDARIDRAIPDRKPPRPDIRRMLRAIGPVAVFGASNFPLAYSVAGGDTASALAVGDPVLVKAHPGHPVTSELTATAVRRAVQACGMPEGVFGMIYGSNPEVSLSLVRHPAIAAVGFTGSQRAGRAIFDAAASRPNPIPVFAEMGSVNPVYVLPGALKERKEKIAEDFVHSFTMALGQQCTKPGIIFGFGSAEWDKFCALVAAHAARVPAGTMLHQGIEATFKRTVSTLHDVGWLLQGPSYVARVDASRFRSRPELSQEVFGPFTLLVSVRNEQELMDIVREQDGQLTSSIHSAESDKDLAAKLFGVLAGKAGRLVNNGFPTGVEVVPSMTHGGPYPASTDARYSAVGTASIYRFARPVTYQNFPEEMLPEELHNANPLGIMRLVDGEATNAPC